MPHHVIPQRPDHPDHAAPRDKDAIVKRIRKFLVAAAGAAAMVVSTGVLEENAEIIVNALLAIATATGVYVAPNAPKVEPAHDPTLRA